MERYNHFEYGEQIARCLKAIRHSDEKPRFFTAFGIEDLYSFDNKLSDVTGMILIAVDGFESDSADNGADGLTDKHAFSFIIAINTVSDRPETITQGSEECYIIAKQIRNRLLQEPNLRNIIDRSTQTNGIGPIGDNYYGVMLTFHLVEPEDFRIDKTFWED